jgi:hypothetical protein
VLRLRLAVLCALLSAVLISVAVTAHAQPAGPESKVGQLNVLLLGPENRNLAGCVVSVAGAQTTTNEQATASLQVPAGTHSVTVRIPKRLLPDATVGAADMTVELKDVTVTDGALTVAIATVDAGGVLANLEIRAPAAAPSAEAPAPAVEVPPAAPSAELGQLRVVLMGPDNRALSGSGVRVADAQATLDEQGAASLDVPAGTHTVVLSVPKASLPDAATSDAEWRVGLSDVTVSAGTLTEVLVTLGSNGSLANLEIRGPGPAGAAPDSQSELDDADSGTTGRVRGTIVAAQGGQKIQGANVYVPSMATEAVSDAAGKFELELPAGSYQLSIIHPEFDTHTVPNVRVKGGKIATLNISLRPPGGMDEWVVTAPRIQGGVAQVLQQRRKSSSMQDAVGAEDIRRSPDSTASTATRRVVGATVVGGQFLFVRGLGGRYSNVRLNGVPLPSTDPDLPGFQIDLFPSSLLSSLTITKTFSPDIPGDFAGGSLNVETQSFPEKFQLNVSFGARYNTQATFKQSPTYRGGDWDSLGFDDGTRAQPDGVPDQRVDAARRGQPGLTRDEVNAIGREFPNNWKLLRTRTLPSLNAGLSVGDTVKVAGRKLGYLVTGGYRLNYSRFDESVINLVRPSGTLEVKDRYKRELGREEVQIGVLGTLNYEVAKGHSIRAVSVLTQNGEDSTSNVGGFSEDRDGDIKYTQYQFIQRQLLFNQLLGEHKDLAGPLQLNWQINASRVRRNQPDTRDVLYERPKEQDVFTISTASPVSGQHLFTSLNQRDFGGGVDLSLPFDKITTKSGYLGRFSKRDFSARRFKTRFVGDPLEQGTLSAEELFAPEHYGTVLEFSEVTRPDDGYTSEERLNAGYAMADTSILAWLRIMGGVRLESFHQGIDVSTPYSTEEPTSRGRDRDYLDLLPAGALIVRLAEEMNLRFAYGMTVARPLARELAPFLSQDFVRRRYTQGNPDLKRTSIHNVDARWEYFLSGTEVLAASAFYKVFRDPIERVILDSAGNGSFQNIDKATNYGAELEARISLRRIADALEDFTLGGNLALIRSEVALSDKQRDQATTSKRPLAGQSPYVVNLSLGWAPESLGVSAFIYYNVYGRRIDEVGFSELPDSYEQPFHSLDLTAFVELGAGFNLGASATNLAGQSLVFRQDKIDVSSSYRGREFGVRLSWTP